MNGFLANRLFERQTSPDGGGDGGAGGVTPPDDQRPEWLLEKFKTPDEQARAYAEAEKRMAQLQTQMDQERQQFAETIQSVQQTVAPKEPEYDPSQDPIILQYEKAVNDGDARAQLAISLELQNRQMTKLLDERMKPVGEQFQQSGQADREMAITLATERVKGRYENWEELAPKIGQVLQQRPHWIPQTASVEAFETTLSEVADLVLAQEARAAATQEESDRIAKLQAQGLTGQGARQPTQEEQKAAWDQIKGVQLGGYSGIIRG